TQTPAAVETIDAESAPREGACEPAAAPAEGPAVTAARAAPAASSRAPRPDGPVAAPTDTEPERIVAVLARLDDRLEESQRRLARQSDIASSLHAENQRLKAGELLRAQLPLVRDVVKLHDLVGQMLDEQPEPAAARNLAILRDAVLDALARNGIEAAPVAESDALDPRRHKIVGVDPTDDPAADRTIAAIWKVGFIADDATPIRPAEVRVFKHTPPVPEALEPCDTPS